MWETKTSLGLQYLKESAGTAVILVTLKVLVIDSKNYLFEVAMVKPEIFLRIRSAGEQKHRPYIWSVASSLTKSQNYMLTMEFNTVLIEREVLVVIENILTPGCKSSIGSRPRVHEIGEQLQDKSLTLVSAKRLILGSVIMRCNTYFRYLAQYPTQNF